MVISNKRRSYDVATFHRLVKDAAASLGAMWAAQKNDTVSKAFQERIMLAVTQVNDCRYCNYVHTKIALKAGVSREEIQDLLNGEMDNVPQEEAVALLFAEHYAESAGHYDPAAFQCVVDTYGGETSGQILAVIRTIMVGNVYGIMVEALKNRLSPKATAPEDSTLGQELGIVLGIFLLIPEVLIRRGLTSLSARTRKAARS